MYEQPAGFAVSKRPRFLESNQWENLVPLMSVVMWSILLIQKRPPKEEANYFTIRNEILIIALLFNLSA
jgi:hypothetical protein